MIITNTNTSVFKNYYYYYYYQEFTTAARERQTALTIFVESHFQQNSNYGQKPELNISVLVCGSGWAITTIIVKKQCHAEEQSSYIPIQICCLVNIKLWSKEPMHRLLGWNTTNGTFKWSGNLKCKFYTSWKETQEDSLNTRCFQISFQLTN